MTAPFTRDPIHASRAPDPVDLHVGARIRKRRWLIGQSQQTLAELCGVQFQQMQKYETGMNRVSASRLYRIASAQGVPVAWYFEGLDQSDYALADDAELMEIARTLSTVPAAARVQIIRLAQTVTADV